MGRGETIIARDGASGPRPAASLTTADYRWVAEEGWSDEQMAAFLRFRQIGGAVNAAHGVPYETGKRRSSPQLMGRWLLEWPNGVPRAMVEAQDYSRAFRTVQVVVSPYAGDDGKGWSDPAALSALSFMVSGIMLLTRADLVALIPLRGEDAEPLVKAAWGKVRMVVSPVAGGLQRLPPLVRMMLIDLDPHEWWVQEHGALDRRTLSYLEKRLDSEERREKAQRDEGKKKRGGALGFFGRLLRW